MQSAVDHWHERKCENPACGKLFRPASKTPGPAMLARTCSYECRYTWDHERRRRGGRGHDNRMKPLDPIDETPCTRCGLRGHVANDPVKCLEGSELWQRGRNARSGASGAEWHMRRVRG